MSERLSTPEAQTLSAGIAEEWRMLRSELAEAVEGRAWEALGYDRMADWLADTLGDMSWPIPSDPEAVPYGHLGGPVVSARVSAPGKFAETRLGLRRAR